MSTLLVSAAVNIGVGILLTLLFPPKGQNTRQEGPRLTDLKVTSSAYGEAIPIHYGTVRTKGNIIWSSGLKETVNTEVHQTGGKGFGGGATQTTVTYTYSADFALSFAEGVADNLLRIWADGKLIYDATGSGPSIGGINFRFHPGNETQQPDPLIEADKGAGQVPGHRGLCYVVFENLQLADFGNRIPNITAEITFNGSVSSPYDGFTLLSGVDYPGGSAGSGGHFALDPFSDVMFTLKMGGSGISRSSLSAHEMQIVGGDTGVGFEQFHVALCSNGYVYYQPGSANGVPIVKLDPVSFAVLGTTTEDGAGFGRAHLGILQKGFPEAGLDPVTLLISGGDYTQGTTGNDGPRFWQDDGGTFTLIGDVDDFDSYDIGDAGPVLEDPWNKRAWVTQEDASGINVYSVSMNLLYDPLFGTGAKIDSVSLTLVGSITKGGTDLPGTANVEGWCMLPDENAVIISNGDGMCKFDLSDGTILASNLTLGFKSTRNWSDNGKFAFPDKDGSGASGGGPIYVVDTDDLTLLDTFNMSSISFGDAAGDALYPRGAYDPRSHSIVVSRAFGTTPASGLEIVQVYLGRASGGGVSVQSVVEDLCDRAGLETTEYDASSLSALTVLGFSIARQTTVRQAIEPLTQAFLFEGFESDWKMKFAERGGSVADTLEPDYVGELTSDPTQGAVKETRLQEVELPERITVQFADKDRDYQDGAAQAKRIFAPTPTMRSQDEQTADLPIVGQATAMKQLADRMLYTVWAQRVNYETRLPWRYLLLDPTDIVSFSYKGSTRRLRMSEIETGVDLSANVKATQEDARSNDSAQTGDGGSGFIVQTVPSVYPTKFLPLDLPLLTAGDASFQAFSRGYWGAAGYEPNWPGCFLYKSADDGSTYTQIGAQSVESAWGVIDGTLPDPITTTTWDDTTTIDLKVYRGIDDFQSSTDLEVLNGANAIAVLGDNGPEIIQFVNATQIDNGTIRISRLLRGRRGTEPNSTNRSPSETFVLLNSLSTLTLQVPLDKIGVSQSWRPVTLGTLLEDAPSVFATYNGEDLKPYSPVQVAAVTNASDVDITWVRRTRFNGELLDGTGSVPLNEQTESYEIDIYDNSTSTLLRTLTATSESVTYTAAQQAADGNPATIDIVVYQISGVTQIDRGRPSDTLTHTV